MIFWMSSTAMGSMPAKGSSRRMKEGEMAEGAGDLEAPPLSPGEGVGGLLVQGRDAQLLQEGPRARAAAPPAGRPRVSRMARTFCSTVSLRKTLASCGQVADAQARPLVHGQGGDVVVAQEDLAAVGPGQAHHHVEGGGLARAVRPQQPHHLAVVEADVHLARPRCGGRRSS